MAKILELMQLSPTMKTGTFVRWLKKAGDAVTADTIIAEVETDKAVMEMMAFEEGILLATLVKEGDQLPVGAPIAIIGEIGEEISDLLEEAKKKLHNIQKDLQDRETSKEETSEEKVVQTSPQLDSSSEKEIVSDDSITLSTRTSLQDLKEIEEFEPERKKSRTIVDLIEVEVSDQTKQILDQPSLNGNISLPPYISLAKTIYRTKYPISPLAKKLARNYDVDISIIQPSDGKRITAKDIENFIKNRKSGIAKEIKPDKKISVSGIRKIIAERLYQSKSNIPHYYLTLEFDANPVLELREKMNQDLQELNEGIRLSLNDFIIRACAKALTKHPVVNSSWQGNTIIQYGRIDIGIAVALESGLITPYVRNADQLEFLEMVKKIRELVKRARERKLKVEEYTNGTFTVSNLGMYGIKEFSAIINEPESAIMAVGTLEQKAVVKDGNIQIGQTVTVTLSCDHRVIDGAEGASFLQTFRKYMENPHLMFM